MVDKETKPGLDDEELLHLAIEASRERRHGDAITHLKQAVSGAKDNYKALYLLAAEHAQIGLTERAIQEFRQTLEIEPGLAAARFQLGLLYLCNARVQEALQAWEPLERLSESDPFLHFKRGLECLARDEFAACRMHVERGIELNNANPALNKDMRRVLDDVTALVSKEPVGQTGTAQPGQILLSAYTSGSK